MEQLTDHIKPMKTTDKKEWIAARRRGHHAALETLRAPGVTTPGLVLWRKLAAVERRAYAYSLALCCDAENPPPEDWRDQIAAEVASIFGHVPPGLRVNGDARGHALKLDCDHATVPDGMERDWGGNGILAAEID